MKALEWAGKIGERLAAPIRQFRLQRRRAGIQQIIIGHRLYKTGIEDVTNLSHDLEVAIYGDTLAYPVVPAKTARKEPV